MAVKRTMTEFGEQETAAYDAMTVQTSCAFCDWSMTGSAVESRERASQHRTDVHPDLPPRRARKTRSLRSFAQKNLRDEDWTEIRTDIAKRKFLLGID